MNPNPEGLVAAIAGCGLVAITLAIVLAAGYGLRSFYQRVDDAADQAGENRAWKHSTGGKSAMAARLPEQAFLEHREPLEDPQPDDLTICRDIARRGTATHRNTRKGDPR